MYHPQNRFGMNNTETTNQEFKRAKQWIEDLEGIKDGLVEESDHFLAWIICFEQFLTYAYGPYVVSHIRQIGSQQIPHIKKEIIPNEVGDAYRERWM